jgi:lipopolysaccharide/colanic/teichoic acid biosynthesis glycosyltransferase
MLAGNQRILKRIFDIVVTLVILPIVVFPLFIILVTVTISTGKNGLFVQNRVGYRGELFRLYKIRTLRGSGHKDAIEIHQNETKFGRWLRINKLDELPQVFNVLIGNMSWVGPRPDIPGYADKLEGEDRIILSVKPGITGPATLKYKNEDKILMILDNPLEYNDTVIWPDKVAINKLYVEHWSFRKDVYYLIASLFNINKTRL